VSVASLQAAEAIKLLVMPERARQGLLEVDLLRSEFRPLPVSLDPDCPACQKGEREFLLPDHHQDAVVVCGRDSVMLQRGEGNGVDLVDIGRRLQERGFQVRANRFRLQLLTGQHELILFADGRALVNGTSEPAVAKRLYADFIGL
jgi:adenylyltransferase/sulfurtransferase